MYVPHSLLCTFSFKLQLAPDFMFVFFLGLQVWDAHKYLFMGSIVPVGFYDPLFGAVSSSNMDTHFLIVKPGGESLIAAGSWCPARNELATMR